MAPSPQGHEPRRRLLPVPNLPLTQLPSDTANKRGAIIAFGSSGALGMKRTGRFLIYGATGFTGKLTARTAKERGLQPILAGRNEAKLKAIAQPLGFSYRVFELSDAAVLDAALGEVDAVLHIAGPFSATSKPMADACLRMGAHYLDITGEIDVFEALAQRDAEARKAGIMMLPGVGFDVVPSDCLALHLKQRLPDAARELASGSAPPHAHIVRPVSPESSHRPYAGGA
jgi:short subunit dehydrogenase-like uncharacterized protein